MNRPVGPDPRLARLLTPREHAAAMELVRRVRRGVPAELWRALLFGSRARGEGRPDSDLDVLLVFHAPYAWIIPMCVAPALAGHLLLFRWLWRTR